MNIDILQQAIERFKIENQEKKDLIVRARAARARKQELKLSVEEILEPIFEEVNVEPLIATSTCPTEQVDTTINFQSEVNQSEVNQSEVPPIDNQPVIIENNYPTNNNDNLSKNGMYKFFGSVRINNDVKSYYIRVINSEKNINSSLGLSGQSLSKTSKMIIQNGIDILFKNISNFKFIEGAFISNKEIGEANISFKSNTNKISFVKEVNLFEDIDNTTTPITPSSDDTNNSSIRTTVIKRNRIVDASSISSKTFNSDVSDLNINHSLFNEKLSPVIKQIVSGAEVFSLPKNHPCFINDKMLNELGYTATSYYSLDNNRIQGRILECGVGKKLSDKLSWNNNKQESGDLYDYVYNGYTVDVKGTIDRTKGAHNRFFDKGLLLKKDKITGQRTANIVIYYSMWEDKENFYFNFRDGISREALMYYMKDYTDNNNNENISYLASRDRYVISNKVMSV